MVDLTIKLRYAAGGHLTNTHSSMIYASVVGRETVRIAFLVEVLNNLRILVCDFQNAYLYADTKEKINYLSRR